MRPLPFPAHRIVSLVTRPLIFLFILSALGCVRVRPVSEIDLHRLSRPRYETVAVEGPQLRNLYYFAPKDSGFDSRHYEPLLREAVEKTGFAADAVAPGAGVQADADIFATYEGMRPATTWGQRGLNFLNGLSLLWVIGVPYQAQQTAVVKLDLFEDGQLVRSVTGEGTARVYSSIYLALRGARQGNQEILRLAVLDAVQKLIAETSPAGPPANPVLD